MHRPAPLVGCLMLAACTLALRVAPASPLPVAAQSDRLLAVSNRLDMKQGDKLEKAGWTLSEAANPDVWTIQLDEGERRDVCLSSEAQSLCRNVGIGDQFDFIVSYDGRDYPTRIIGAFIPPMARFTPAYQAANRGKVNLEVPEVYELINVAIALTATAQKSPGLIATDTPYYQEVMKDFGSLSQHPLVLALDQKLRQDLLNYHNHKMDGITFEYNDAGDVVRSRIYDRIVRDPVYFLAPMLPQIQSFSRDSGFRNFYAAHKNIYRQQVDYYRNDVDIERMFRWLKQNFPAVKPYDSTKIIWSPLVASSQSLAIVEGRNFTELQPHVNFPYPDPASKSSPDAKALRAGTILFTELNHGFINPTAEAYATEIDTAVGDGGRWAAKGSPAEFYRSNQLIFDEMMNWGLVSLFYLDFAPAAERDAMIKSVDRIMGERRGFMHFPKFSAFLVPLYRDRPQGSTIADLYPQIIRWFAEHRPPRPVALPAKGK